MSQRHEIKLSDAATAQQHGNHWSVVAMPCMNRDTWSLQLRIGHGMRSNSLQIGSSRTAARHATPASCKIIILYLGRYSQASDVRPVVSFPIM